MARTILGPALAAFSVAAALPPTPAVDAAGNPVAAAPATPAKADPVPTLGAVNANASPFSVGFTLPAYDLGTNNKLTTITVVVMPKGHGEPTTAEGWEKSSYHKGTLDVSANQTGGPVSVTVPNLPKGDFVGQVLYTFDA